MKTAVGLLSCQAYATRRNLCRVTWLPAVNSLDDVDVFFLIGGSRQGIDGDSLHLAVDDTYAALPQKTQAFCEWASRRDYTHVFKADDDTFIHPRRFAAFLAEHEHHDYVGNEWKPGKGYASGGAGYLLSRPCLEHVSRIPIPVGAEDILTGFLMQNAGVPFTIDSRLIAHGFVRGERPLPENDLITTHKIETLLWLDSWNATRAIQ
jgi:hypothetical protein